MLRFLFVVDCDVSIGMGHFMRCNAIADECLSYNVNITFAMNRFHESIKHKIIERGLGFIEFNLNDKIEKWLTPKDYELIIIDGYHFSKEFRHKLYLTNVPVLVIDDSFCQQPLYADFILNPQENIPPSDYPDIKPGNQMLGLRYLPLRNEFSDYVFSSGHIKKTYKNVFLNFGGTDPLRLTCSVLENLILHDRLSDVQIDVIVGDRHPDTDNLKTISKNSQESVKLYTAVSNISELMKKAEVAISAAGSTLWELAVIRVPTIPIITADNQAVIKKYSLWPIIIDARDVSADSVAELIINALEKIIDQENIFDHYFKSIDHLNISNGTKNICKFLVKALSENNE